MYEQIRKKNLPHLMQAIGVDGDQLILPHMACCVKDCLEKSNRRVSKELSKVYVDQKKDLVLRSKLVAFAIEALAIGLDHLHNSVYATHRDIKPENLLLRRSPFDEHFSSADILIADLGYASMRDVNEHESAHDLPGTQPYIAPDVLKLRLDRRDRVKGVLAKAAAAFRQDVQLEVAARDANILVRDHEKHVVRDLEALDLALKLGGGEIAEARGEIAKLVAEARTRTASDQLLLDWQKNDVYSAAICMCVLFNFTQHPFPDLRLGGANEDRDLYRHLTSGPGGGNRPALYGAAAKQAVPEQLWLTIVQSELKWLEASWDNDPAKRPTAKGLCAHVRQALEEFKHSEWAREKGIFSIRR